MVFTRTVAQDLMKEAQKGNFLSKGKIIDICRAAAKKGHSSVEVKGMPLIVQDELTKDHKLSIKGDVISWEE